MGVRGGGVWGESVELQRFILFICILSLFSVREVISFSSIVMLFYKRFLAPPRPLPAPPIFECVILINSILSV